MQRRWIDFEDGPESLEKDEIYATLNSKGELVLNRVGFDAIGQPDYFKLKYDKYNIAMGLEQVPRHTPGAFPLKRKGRCGHRVIRVKPFCKKWAIDVAHTVRFREPVVEDGVLVLNLKRLRNATRGPRRKKGH